MKRHKSSAGTASNPGFQIAPMIDVVFVVMLFFMVMAGAARKEVVNVSKLPGPPAPGLATPDEISIRVDEDGQVSLNEDPLDSPDSARLPQLAAQLKQLKTGDDAADPKLLVTIDAAENARYQRVVDVLDALSEADIRHVTFRSE